MQERLKRWTGRSFATGAKAENLTTPFDTGFIYDSLDKGAFTPSEEGNAKNSPPFHERAYYAIPKFAMKILTPPVLPLSLLLVAIQHPHKACIG